jgi:hypothetical protein
VARPDRRPVNKLPFKEFDAIVFTQNAGLAQAVVIFHRQSVPADRMTAQNVDVPGVHVPGVHFQAIVA